MTETQDYDPSLGVMTKKQSYCMKNILEQINRNKSIKNRNVFTVTWSFFLWVLQWNGFLRHSIFYSLPQFPLLFTVLLESALLFKLFVF